MSKAQSSRKTKGDSDELVLYRDKTLQDMTRAWIKLLQTKVQLLKGALSGKSNPDLTGIYTEELIRAMGIVITDEQRGDEVELKKLSELDNPKQCPVFILFGKEKDQLDPNAGMFQRMVDGICNGIVRVRRQPTFYP